MILLPAAVRAKAVVGSPLNKDFVLQRGYRGILLRLNITASSGTTPTLDVKVQFYDEAAQTYEDLTDWGALAVAFAQKTGANESDLLIYPSGVAGAANARMNVAPPRKLRIVSTYGADADESFTFSLVGLPLE